MISIETLRTRWFFALSLPVLLGCIFASSSTAVAGNSKADQEAGAVLFRDKGCAYCHGAATQGTSRGPSLVNIRKTWKAQQIHDQIVNGGQKMPSFQDALSQQEVFQLVQFLRAKHRPVPPVVAVPAPVSNPAQ